VVRAPRDRRRGGEKTKKTGRLGLSTTRSDFDQTEIPLNKQMKKLGHLTITSKKGWAPSAQLTSPAGSVKKNKMRARQRGEETAWEKTRDFRKVREGEEGTEKNSRTQGKGKNVEVSIESPKGGETNYSTPSGITRGGEKIRTNVERSRQKTQREKKRRYENQELQLEGNARLLDI